MTPLLRWGERGDFRMASSFGEEAGQGISCTLGGSFEESLPGDPFLYD